MNLPREAEHCSQKCQTGKSGKCPIGLSALFTGAVFAFALGGLWCSPKMFGTRWAEGSGIQTVDGHPVNALATQGAGTFSMAWLIGIAAAANAYCVVALIILTIVTILAGGCLFSRKNAYAVLTESGFVVVNGIIMVISQLLL